MVSPKDVIVTWHSIVCPFFGSPKELSGTSQPTYKDMLPCCLEEKNKCLLLFNSNNKKELSFSPVAKLVATQLLNIYRRVSISTDTHPRVVQMMTSYFNSYIGLKKIIQTRP